MCNIITKHAQLPDASVEFARKYPHRRRSFIDRPDPTRRAFFQLAAAGITGSFLLPRLRAAAPGSVLNSGMKTANTAKNVIFIHLTGAVSHVDTLDLKSAAGSDSNVLQPTTVNGVAWPMGILPKMSAHVKDLGLVRADRKSTRLNSSHT